MNARSKWNVSLRKAAQIISIAALLSAAPSRSLGQTVLPLGASVNGNCLEGIGLIDVYTWGISFADDPVRSMAMSIGQLMGIDPSTGLRIEHPENILPLIQVGSLGIGLHDTPGQRLHIGDGNVLVEGGGETALLFKRHTNILGGASGQSKNPIFQLGRIVVAGDGDPEFRFLYSDDFTAEHPVLEFDRKGIVASVKTNVGSHFEGFIKDSVRDANPMFRLNSYPTMRLEMGGGTNEPSNDVALERSALSTLAFYTGGQRRLTVLPGGSTGIGTSQPKSMLHVSGGVQIGNDSDSASAQKVGTLRYTSTATSSAVEMCMQTGASTFEWVTIKSNTW